MDKVIDEFFDFLQRTGRYNNYIKDCAHYRRLGDAKGQKQIRETAEKVRKFLMDNYVPDDKDELVATFCWQTSDSGITYWKNANWEWKGEQNRNKLGRKKK